MDFKFFISGVINILFRPVKAWETINSENKSVKVVRNSYLFPLLILISASAITGSLLFTHTELSPLYSVLMGIKCFILLFVTVYTIAFMIGEITYPLDLGRNFSILFRITVYSITPFLLCQILSRFFESLQFMNVIGLYGLYIFYTGAEKLLNPPQYKMMPLLIATLFIMAGIYIVSSIILNILIDKIFYAFIS